MRTTAVILLADRLIIPCQSGPTTEHKIQADHGEPGTGRASGLAWDSLAEYVRPEGPDLRYGRVA
jgi:hypothetical protein